MQDDAASLSNMRDIVLPPPVSWWPLAPGWWLLGLVVITLAAICTFRWVASYRRAAYRRTARRQLQTARTLMEVEMVLRQTAIAAYPRREIASLTGQTWIHWLSAQSGLNVPDEVGLALTESVYRSVESDPEPARQFVASWIDQHRGDGTRQDGNAIAESKTQKSPVASSLDEHGGRS